MLSNPWIKIVTKPALCCTVCVCFLLKSAVPQPAIYGEHFTCLFPFTSELLIKKWCSVSADGLTHIWLSIFLKVLFFWQKPQWKFRSSLIPLIKYKLWNSSSFNYVRFYKKYIRGRAAYVIVESRDNMFAIKYTAGSHSIVPLSPFPLLEHITRTSSL